FYNTTTAPVLSPLSLHDALPICKRDRNRRSAAWRERDRKTERLQRKIARVRTQQFQIRDHQVGGSAVPDGNGRRSAGGIHALAGDRKSTRLNSSHVKISYAVFCL